HNHIETYWKKLEYSELRHRNPDLPTRIIECPCCGLCTGTDENPEQAMIIHCQRSCPMPKRYHGRPTIEYRIIKDAEEVRRKFISLSPIIKKCNPWGFELENSTKKQRWGPLSQHSKFFFYAMD